MMHQCGPSANTRRAQSVLTTAFFLFAFFVGAYAGFFLLFNLIFSYLWIVAVAFTAQAWSNNYVGALEHTVEAFCFIALCVHPECPLPFGTSS